MSHVRQLSRFVHVVQWRRGSDVLGGIDSIAQYCIHYREYWLYHGKDWLECFFLSLDSGLRDDLLFMNCTQAFLS